MTKTDFLTRGRRALWVFSCASMLGGALFAPSVLADKDKNKNKNKEKKAERIERRNERWEDRDERRRDRDDDDDDYRRNDSYRRSDERATVAGVVTRVRNSRSFDLRDRNGRTILVQSDREVNIRTGDRVFVRGEFNGNSNTFRARVVAMNVTGDRNDPYDNPRDDDDSPYSGNRTVDFGATVTRRISNNEIEVRGDNGRTYRVYSSYGFGSSVDRGDRIRVRGTWDGSRVRVNGSVGSGGSGWGNGGNYGDYSNNQRVDFSATVLNVNRATRQIQVRGDNGRLYTVKVSETQARYLFNGDRLRVRGTYRSGVINDSTIERIR